MSRYFTKTLSALELYVPGEQLNLQNLVKLNANENPYPPSPAVAQAVAHMASARYTVYQPDAGSAEIYDRLYAEYARLHDYFGRGENDVMKRLKRIREGALKQH